MKKRIISLFLAVVMIVGMLPLSAITAFAEDNDIPNGGEEKTAWTFDNALPQSSGEYYLTKDVMLANAWTVKAGEDIFLDLNGHTIRRDLPTAQSNGYVIGVSGKLTLSDSSAEKTGLITGGNNTGNGGGLYINSGAVVVMTDCRIEGNTAVGAAGIFNSGTLTATRCSISNNRATGNAGGFYGSAGEAIFTDCKINNNRSDNYGGAFFVDYTASVTLDGCTVSGNSAKNGGGAFEMEKTDGKLVLKDSSVIGNSVDVKNNNMFKGGGIHFNLGSVTLKGKVVLKDNLCASLTNNICVRNTTVNFNASAMTADSEIYLNDGALAVISGITEETLEALHMENGYHIAFSEDGKLISHRPVFSGKYIDCGDGTHARKCQLCNRLSAKEAHIDANQDGNCDICGEIELKTGNLGLLTEGLNTASAATVNFGTDKDGNPIAFRVIGDENSGVKAPKGCLTLISADLVAPPQPFNTEENNSASYKGSMLQATVDSSVTLSEAERAAVRPRTLEGGKSYKSGTVCDGISGMNVENALFWAPTTADATAMSTDLLGASNDWWLCSPGGFLWGSGIYKAGVVHAGIGSIMTQGYDVKEDYGVRVAFYLDLSSVLFAASDSGNVKLTLIDKARSFDVTSVSGTAEKLTVSYTGAKTGSNESIAYFVAGADGIPGNLTTIASVTTENGTVEFDRPSLASGERLFLANIGNKPSVGLSSEPVEIEMPCIHDFTGTKYHDNGDGTHSAVCVKCGSLSDPVAHITGNEYRDNGNGTHSQKCTVCGGYLAAVYHTYESVDTETHRCTVCSFSEKHTDDGVCGLCGQIQYYYEYNEELGEFEKKAIPEGAVEIDSEDDLKTDDINSYNFHEEWYVITKSFSLSRRAWIDDYFDTTATKNIHIILADNVTLSATAGGIRVCNPLTVYATTLDESKMGTIRATGAGEGEAGIGSGVYENTGGYGSTGFNSYPCAGITIHGGKFYAKGGNGGAGIGGGWTCSDYDDGFFSLPAGDITIYGGNFEVYGGTNAPAIGAGLKCFTPNCDINIFGGTFNGLNQSTGNAGRGGAAALGSGGSFERLTDYYDYDKSAWVYLDKVSSIGDINIHGGFFRGVYGMNDGAGIGSGSRGKCGKITIDNGTFIDIIGDFNFSPVTDGNAKVGGGAAIGSGYLADCGNIEINNGVFHYLFSKDYGAGIGSGSEGTCGNITINGGVFDQIYGGAGAAGIGSGYKGRSGTVTINGGYMQVYGGGIPYGSTLAQTATPDIGKGDAGKNDVSVVWGSEVCYINNMVKDGSGKVVESTGNIAGTPMFTGSIKNETCTETGHKEVYCRMITRFVNNIKYVDGLEFITSPVIEQDGNSGFYENINGTVIGNEAKLAEWLATPVSEGGGMIPALGHIDEDGNNTCDRCGAENIHDFTGEYKDNGNGTHSRKCTECDDYGATEAHTFVNHECVCGATNGHNFTGEYKDNGNGTHSQKCTGCDEYGATEAHTFVNHECVCGAHNDHDFTGEYKNNGNGTHSQKCTECDEYGATENHAFVNHICACGAENIHDFTGEYKDNGNGTHSQKCTGCDEYGTTEAHTWQSVDKYTHKCTVCDTVENHTDSNKDSVCDECEYVLCYHENTVINYTWGEDYQSCTATKHCNDCGNDILTENAAEIKLIEDTHGANCQTMGKGHYEATFATLGTAKTAENGVDTAKGEHHYIDFICEYCQEEDLEGAKANAIDELAAALTTDFSAEVYEQTIEKLNAATTVEEVEAIKNAALAEMKEADALYFAMVNAAVEINAAKTETTAAIADEAINNIRAATTVEAIEEIRDEALAKMKEAMDELAAAKLDAVQAIIAAETENNVALAMEFLPSVFSATTVEQVTFVKVYALLMMDIFDTAFGALRTLNVARTEKNGAIANKALDEISKLTDDIGSKILSGLGDGTVEEKLNAYKAEVNAILEKALADMRTADFYAGMSLTLGSDIAINFYVELSEEARQNGTMTFDIGGRIVTLKGTDAKYNETEKKYYFQTPLTALEMNETVKATFKFNGIEYVQEYSVQQYIDKIVSDSEKYGEKAVALAKKIANYGYYAQIYLESIHTNVTIVEPGEDSDKGYDRMIDFCKTDNINVDAAKTALAKYAVTVSGTSDNLKFYGSTVYFDSATALNYYVTVKNGEKPTATALNTKTGKSKDVEIKLYKDNIYIVSVKDITATELADEITVTIDDDITVTGSVFAYCNSVVKAHNIVGATAKDKFAVDAMAAFYEYYEAACEYAKTQVQE